MIRQLDVMLWNRKVGTLLADRVKYKTNILFYFDPDFVKSGLDIAPLRASINGAAAKSGFPIYPDSDKIFGGLPSFISDSLPDHWGNKIFKEWAMINKIHTKDLSPLDLLAYIGRRGMGALEFVPPSAEEMENPFKVEIENLSELAQKMLTDSKNFHVKFSDDLSIESLFKVGTSAGGRRPKAVINYDPATGECFSGQVENEDPRFIPMIIKFDEHQPFPSTKIEYCYYLMAIEAGMDMSKSFLLNLGRESHFLTQRFDRVSGRKLHIQTLAAMNPLATSYEELFETGVKLSLPEEDIQQFYLQMVMNVLAGNIDDHTKNFSFIMNEKGEWRKAPAYDFTFTIDLDAPEYINRHSISINGCVSDITEHDLLEVAKRFDIKGAKTIIDRAKMVIANFRKFAAKAQVDEKWIERIEEYLGT